MTTLVELLEKSWLILFLVSIVFIAIIVIRELGEQTRRKKQWHRIPYAKMLPRISLTSQHFNRKGELLTNTSHNICRSIRKDLLDFMQIQKGYSTIEMKELIKNKEKLHEIFQDDSIVIFIYNPAQWLSVIHPDPSIISKIFQPLKILFKEQEKEENNFYIELATIINKFRRTIESS